MMSILPELGSAQFDELWGHLGETSRRPAELMGLCALVVSGSRGLGRVVAEELVHSGARVAITGPDEASHFVEPVRDIHAVTGHRTLPAIADSGRNENRKASVDLVMDRWGRLDLLVHNSVIDLADCTRTAVLDPDCLRQLFKTTVLDALDYIHLARGVWMAQHGGAVRMISAAGTRSEHGPAERDVVHAAVRRLTADLAQQFGPRVRINTLASAIAATGNGSATTNGLATTIAHGASRDGVGQHREAARAAVMLLSAGSSWLTGATFLSPVDSVRLRVNRLSDTRNATGAENLALSRSQAPIRGGGDDVHNPDDEGMTLTAARVVASTTTDRLAELTRRRELAVKAGSATGYARQYAQGKQTTRERIDRLLDPGSFMELDQLARHRSVHFGQDRNRPHGDGVVTGYGTVDGRRVCVFAQDFAVFGGSLGEVLGEKIVKVMDLAARVGCPVIGLNDSAGGRIQEGVAAQAAYGAIFTRNVRLSGVVPQLSLSMGPCAGGAVYSPALSDFVVMVDRTSHMFVTGPDVVRTVTGEQVSFEELGGARVHSTTSGNAHYLGVDEEDAITYVKRLLSYLPSNNLSHPPATNAGECGGPGETCDLAEADLALNTVIPDAVDQPYDMRAVITCVLDDGDLLQVHERFAPNVIIGFGRVAGHSVGVVANQPAQLAGFLDIDGSEKAARFIRTCDAFNVPILTFVDVPGFLPGLSQEARGAIRRDAKLVHAYAEATVPLVTVITRRAYDTGYIAMGSKHLGADVVLAWPSAQIAVTSAGSSVAQGAIEDAGAPLTPYEAADWGYVDEVIVPAQTRRQVTRALAFLHESRTEQPPPKKHGNIPL